jgi:hypothetical protein
MSDWNRIWRVLVPVLLIVTVLATAMGMVCHQHHDRYSADQCTLCHLVIAPTVGSTGVSELALEPAHYAVQAECFTPRFVADQISSRAPPA